MLRCNLANQSPVRTMRRTTLMRGILAATAVAPAALLAVHAVTISPVVVNGGASAIATVRLDAAAPLAGASVLLASNRTSVATVPPKLAIPARARSGTFTVNGVAGAGGCATISARVSSSNTTQSALISVRPTNAPGPLGLTLQADTVVGGSSLTGTVTVQPGAGLGNLVQLSSSSPTVTVPASVTVAPIGDGVPIATFNIGSTVVPPPGTCSVITATIGSTQKRALLRVMPLVQG